MRGCDGKTTNFDPIATALLRAVIQLSQQHRGRETDKGISLPAVWSFGIRASSEAYVLVVTFDTSGTLKRHVSL